MSPVPYEELEKLDPEAFAATKEPQDSGIVTKQFEWTGGKPAEAGSMPDPKDWNEVTSKL
jgi:hypothetical protein